MKQYLRQLIKFANPVISLIISIIGASLLTIIDYFNYITRLFMSFNKPYVVVLFVSAVLICALCVLYIRPISQFKNKSITSLDLIFIRLELALILYLIWSIIFCGYNWIKTGLLVGVIVGIFICLLIRYVLFTKTLKLVLDNESRIVDLKKIFENNLPNDNSLPIFINEKDVDYDLLDRQSMINQLVSSIKNYNTDGSYVIGLVGSWGSVKTTIINNAKTILKKDENQIIVIDEFDPWLYENQDALLVAMFEIIMKEAGVKYSFKNLKRVCNIIKEVIGLSEKTELVSKALALIAPDDMNYMASIKDRINDFLTLNDKYVVVVIDNIERATAENVIFLFKLIGTLFDLKRITYVLSYDKERLDKIFEDSNKIDCHYIEKIVQQEISVPTIQNSKCSEIYSTCFCNLLQYYNVDTSDMPSFKFIVDFITDEIKDLRTFKRLINSTFATVFAEDKSLYKPDLLALEVIRFYDSDLYYNIYNNRNFFVSDDRTIDHDIDITFTLYNDKFNEEGKNFLNSLLQNRSQKIIDLLASVFPYVDNYKKMEELIPKYSYSKADYSGIQLNGRVCSAKFFDLYFCFGANEYLAIKEDVKDFVNMCNSGKQLTDLLLSERIFKNNHDFQEEWFSMLQFHISEIKEDTLFNVIRFLTSNFDNINNVGAFLSPSALLRVGYIIFCFLKSCAEANFSLYLQFINKKYNRLILLEHLCSFFDKDPDNTTLSDRFNELRELYENMCNEIITKNINMYDDKNYLQKNIWALVRYLKARPELKSIKDYISGVLNESTVFRLLGDIIVESISNKYNYYLSKDAYELFFGDNDLESLVERAESKTESQEFVKRIYLNYIHGTENEFGEKALSFTRAQSFKL